MEQLVYLKSKMNFFKMEINVLKKMRGETVGEIELTMQILLAAVPLDSCFDTRFLRTNRAYVLPSEWNWRISQNWHSREPTIFMQFMIVIAYFYPQWSLSFVFSPPPLGRKSRVWLNQFYDPQASQDAFIMNNRENRGKQSLTVQASFGEERWTVGKL